MPRNNAKTEADDQELTFEKALERLDELVAELESGELTLEESLARYEEGRKLVGQCYKLLEHAEKRIEQVVQGEDGALKTEPFMGETPDTEGEE